MSLIRLILNVLWIVTGGVWMALAWVIAGVIMVITIIGIPWARAAFNIALYTLLPFGHKAVRPVRGDGIPGRWYRAAGCGGQHHLVCACRLVVGARAPD